MKNKWTKIVKNAKLDTIGQKWTKMKGGRLKKLDKIGQIGQK